MTRHRDPYKTLKSTFCRLVELFGGPTEAAEETRIGKDLMSRYSSLSDQNVGRHAPIDVVFDLEQRIVSRGGEPLVTRMMADLHGFDLVPRHVEAVPANYSAHATDITRACGVVTNAWMEALADGRVGEDELRQIDALVGKLQKEAAEFRVDAGHELGRVTPFRASA